MIPVVEDFSIVNFSICGIRNGRTLPPRARPYIDLLGADELWYEWRGRSLTVTKSDAGKWNDVQAYYYL